MHVSPVQGLNELNCSPGSVDVFEHACDAVLEVLMYLGDPVLQDGDPLIRRSLLA